MELDFESQTLVASVAATKDELTPPREGHGTYLGPLCPTLGDSKHVGCNPKLERIQRRALKISGFFSPEDAWETLAFEATER